MALRGILLTPVDAVTEVRVVSLAALCAALSTSSCAAPARGDAISSDAAAEEAAPITVEASAPSIVDARAASPPTLYVITGEVDVRERPATEARRIGVIRAGGFGRLTGERFSGDSGCPNVFVGLSPFGFICESSATTRDANAPAVAVLEEYRLADGAALPASYGFARETPVYLRVPTYDEQARSEPGFVRRARQKAASGESEATAGERPSREPPDNLRGGAFAPFAPKPAAPGSPVTGILNEGAPVAWVAEFEAAGRSWLLTPDLLFVPRDHVRRAIVSGFHGAAVVPGSRAAFIRVRRAAKYQSSPSGFTKQKDAWGFGATVLIPAGASPITVAKKDYLPTLEAETYVRADDVLLVAPLSGSRWGINQSDRWLEVDASANALFVHEGPSVVFATLVSAGGDMTPRGKFKIVAKHLALSPPFDGTRHRGASGEVPHVLLAAKSEQDPPAFAVFAGWWMSSWGQSGHEAGIALAPLDARRLVDWTTPKLPDGWQSISDAGTWIVVHD